MEWRRGLELVAMVVHIIFVGVVVPQMWEFFPHTIVLAKPSLEPTAVVQVVHKRLLLQTETSFYHGGFWAVWLAAALLGGFGC